VLAAAVVTAGLALPLALDATPAAASQSAFCTTVFSYRSYAQAPKAYTIAGYHAWAKALVPFYEKLQSEAPTPASKKVLGEIVTILKYYEISATYPKLLAYEASHRAQWIAGTKSLAAAIASCAKYLG
jgi:hypothetical protein